MSGVAQPPKAVLQNCIGLLVHVPRPLAFWSSASPADREHEPVHKSEIYIRTRLVEGT